jgi:hypothetical protein
MLFYIICLYLPATIKKKIMYQLKDEYLKRIAADPELIGKIAKVTGKEIFSVIRWLETGSDQLTKYAVLYTISRHYNITRVDSLVKLQVNDKRKKVAAAVKEPQ